LWLIVRWHRFFLRISPSPRFPVRLCHPLSAICRQAFHVSSPLPSGHSCESRCFFPGVRDLPCLPPHHLGLRANGSDRACTRNSFFVRHCCPLCCGRPFLSKFRPPFPMVAPCTRPQSTEMILFLCALAIPFGVPARTLSAPFPPARCGVRSAALLSFSLVYPFPHDFLSSSALSRPP